MCFDLEQKVQRRHAESRSLILTNHYGHDVSTGHWAELSWWRVKGDGAEQYTLHFNIIMVQGSN